MGLRGDTGSEEFLHDPSRPDVRRDQEPVRVRGVGGQGKWYKKPRDRELGVNNALYLPQRGGSYKRVDGRVGGLKRGIRTAFMIRRQER